MIVVCILPVFERTSSVIVLFLFFFVSPLYNTGEQFTCFDGSKTFSFAKVNDDYCDCPDGSDEPGTSACENGVFHCMNLGYKADDIPSSRVNDQICDCCDGSDEWDSAVDCPNICEKVGEKYREEKQRKAVVIRKGYEKRIALAAEGKKLKEEKSKGVDSIKKEKDDLEPFQPVKGLPSASFVQFQHFRDAEAFLNGDYGSDDAWASLKGNCFEMDESQYTYRLCLFDKAIQKERNGAIEINLGSWHEWSGGATDKYSEQTYNKGQQCWNGPERSTKVILECGEGTALVEASEPARCEYRFVLTSPAACPDPNTLVEHEEL
ncbi:unnamed protein product [Enterobius vermicularis]|uniref:Glucosidase 2 subunit beta n=1 Tax=Enterobius vermicularis TaxID=51028 RepID=A0A0N4VA42_ENTVE|nr:unnamed protein product [Enterobius vermicularis]